MLLLCVLCFLPAVVFSAHKGDKCTNRWGEKATCTNVYSCKSVSEILHIANSTTYYVAGSICGYDNEPLVCCIIGDEFYCPEKITTQNPPVILDSKNSFTTEFVPTEFNKSAAVGADLGFRIDISKNSSSSSENQTLIVEQFYTSPPYVTEQTPLVVETSRLGEVNPLKSETTTPKTTTQQITTQEIVTHPPVPHNTPTSEKLSCGVENPSKKLANSSISAFDEFPWLALLKYRYSNGNDAGFRCVATLIDRKHLITSASCVVTDPHVFSLESVRLGAWSINSLQDCVNGPHGEECTDQAVDVNVKYKIPHPHYEPSQGKNDIAVICLQKLVDFSDFIRPICLPHEHLEQPYGGCVMTTAGWGTSKYGYQLDIKSKINVPVVSRSSCNKVYGYSRTVDHRVCIGEGLNTEKCATDSGGPVMRFEDKHKFWYLEGVISHGFSCSAKGSHGLYTRLTAYVGWILDALEQKA